MKEGIAEILMIGFELLVIPLVHGDRFGLNKSRRNWRCEDKR